MKDILCVVDFGEDSGKVLKVAADLADASHARLIVIFPYRLINPDYSGDMNALKKRLESEANRKFQDLTTIFSRTGKSYAGISFGNRLRRRSDQCTSGEK